MKKQQILIVDDDKDILELLEYNLINEGYDVIGMLNTSRVRSLLEQEEIDLIIMDRSLPEIEGSYYIEMLRSRDIQIPVIFLSAKDSKSEIIDGFYKGADDYITKPFDIEELKMRIKAVLKRYHGNLATHKASLEYRDMVLDLNMNKVFIDTFEITLTKLETALLKLLITNKGRVLNREFIIKNVWNNNEDIHKKTVNVAIKRLKEKIDPNATKNYIKTVRGIGYMANA